MFGVCRPKSFDRLLTGAWQLPQLLSGSLAAGPKDRDRGWACCEVTGHGGEEWLAPGILPELGTPHVTEVGFFRLVAL